MAKYRVLEPSFVDGLLVTSEMITAAGAAGYIVEYDGITSHNLMLVEGNPAEIEKRNKARLLAEAKAMGIEGLSEADTLDAVRLTVGSAKSRELNLTATPATSIAYQQSRAV